jgi:hypothetical protein
VHVANEQVNNDLNIVVFGGIYPGVAIVEFAIES